MMTEDQLLKLAGDVFAQQELTEFDRIFRRIPGVPASQIKPGCFYPDCDGGHSTGYCADSCRPGE